MEKSDIVYHLDQLRRDKKVTIQAISQGVISRRNYTRLLSGEIEISLEILEKLLANLNVPLDEFAYYRYNNQVVDHFDEYEFHEVIRFGNYERAIKKFAYFLTKPKFVSIFSGKTIPIGILMLKKHLGQISNNELVHASRELMNLSESVKSHIIYDDLVEALYLYCSICNETELDEIISFCERALFGGKAKMFTLYFEVATIILHLTLMRSLLLKKTITESEHILFKRTINSGLKFGRLSKLQPFDVMFFGMYDRYNKKYKLHNPFVTFYYFNYLETSEHIDVVNRSLRVFTKSEREDILKCMMDPTLREGALYDKVLFHELL